MNYYSSSKFFSRAFSEFGVFISWCSRPVNDFLLNFVLGSFGDCVAEGGDTQAILVHWVANLPVLSVCSGLAMLCFWISFEMR